MKRPNMEIRILDNADKRVVHEFLRLPFRLYSDIPQWVPPFSYEVKRCLYPEKHPFYKYGEAGFFVAEEAGRLIGRVAVLENRNFNTFNHQNSAFFYLFECENNYQASSGLFEAAFEWARQRNLNQIHGPRGFTVFDGLGVLVKGFEHRPAFGLPYNPPYYPRLIENSGFHPKEDIVSGYLDESMKFPDQILQAAELVKKRRGLEVKPFKNRREIRQLIPYLKDLYNSAFTTADGNIPLTDEDVDLLATQMLWFADPSLIKIVMKDNSPVGFLMAYPDISAGMQKAHGNLFPFGWLILLLELRRTKWININGAGMLPGFRGLGGTALLFSEMYKSVSLSRYRFADLVQIGTENENMQREMRNFGINFYKTHRIYERSI